MSHQVQRNSAPPSKLSIFIANTELHTWFERDRAHVELRNTATGETIIEWWDEDVAEAIEDGFLSPKNYHRSAFEYAKEIGMVN